LNAFQNATANCTMKISKFAVAENYMIDLSGMSSAVMTDCSERRPNTVATRTTGRWYSLLRSLDNHVGLLARRFSRGFWRATKTPMPFGNV